MSISLVNGKFQARWREGGRQRSRLFATAQQAADFLEMVLPAKPAPLTNHPLYGTWSGIVYRCRTPTCPEYPSYGGRGIKVCDRWLDSRAFIEDIERELGPRPEGMTLDRIDNDGDYESGNVRWATRTQQARNTRLLQIPS